MVVSLKQSLQVCWVVHQYQSLCVCVSKREFISHVSQECACTIQKLITAGKESPATDM